MRSRAVWLISAFVILPLAARAADTPLVEAVRNDDVRTVQSLLKSGADANIRDDFQRFDDAFCELAHAIIRNSVGRNLVVRCNLPLWISISRDKRVLELDRRGAKSVVGRLLPSNPEDKATPIELEVLVDHGPMIRLFGRGASTIDAAGLQLVTFLTDI